MPGTSQDKPGKRARAVPTVPGISGAVVGPIVELLEEMGFDPHAETGELEPARVVPGPVADRWLDAAAVRLNDQAIGLTLASKLPIGALGILDYALSTSQTLRDALGRVAKHYGIVTQRVTLSLVEEPPRATLVFERRPGLEHSRHWLEFSFAILAQRMRQTMGKDVAFFEVSFVHGAPRGPTPHDAFFGAPVRFGAEADRLGFDRALLDMPLRTGSASLAELLDARMKEMSPPGAVDSFLTQVRQVLLLLLDERDVRVESAAARLHMSTRTLQRELHQRRTSHKDMLDAVRRERALRLLSEAVTVADVAARLAYSEPSAFFRAFRRWTGTSPRASREAGRE